MSNPRHASGMNIFPLVLLFLSVSFLESVFGSSSGRSVLFMQGDSQALAPNTLWSMDLSTLSAHKLGTSTKMFTSHGALCGGKYHSIYWELPDPTNPFNRTYGLASFDVSKSNATFIEIPLPNNYYGVWCSPAKLGGDLLVVMAKRGSDPLRMKEFFVQSLSTDATKVTTLAGPIAAPAKEYIPIADGIFSFDGTSQMWMSFSIGSNESHGIFHADKGITHVVDLETQADTTYETRDEQGYLVLTQAVPPGSKTWGVLKKLSRKDRRLSLTFVDLQLGPGGSMSVRKVGDALLIANSQGLPGGQCGNTLLTFNTDDYDGPFQRYYNITAIDTQTGKAIWNLDTLTALPGSRRAFVTGFACQ